MLGMKGLLDYSRKYWMQSTLTLNGQMRGSMGETVLTTLIAA